METQEDDVDICSDTQEDEDSNTTNMNDQGDTIMCSGGKVIKIFMAVHFVNFHSNSHVTEKEKCA